VRFGYHKWCFSTLIAVFNSRHSQKYDSYSLERQAENAFPSVAARPLLEFVFFSGVGSEVTRESIGEEQM
jgi:hypothetical protein